METFFLLLFIPVVIAAIARWKFEHTIAWPEVAVQIVFVSLVVSGVWFAGKYGQTHDFEIWNGEVTSKQRDHGHYVESYKCFCHQSCSGTGENRSCHEVCQTCYRDHYTVHWYLETTIGDIRLEYMDRTSRRVYDEPDPPQYRNARVGEACSAERSYTNYIQAVPESLFNTYSEAELAQFTDLIPVYPRVHSYYKFDRVLTMGMGDSINHREWDDYIDRYQKVLGNSHQVNIILLIVNTPDQMYRHALEQAWLGGKKNDVIVLIGSSNYPAIDWVDTITLGRNSGNELMTVEMRDNLMGIGTLEDHKVVVGSMVRTIEDKFDRKPMSDYEYLKDEIDPPVWVIVLAFFLSVALSIGATIFFHHTDYFDMEQRRYNRRYR
jgi:hypothetical protein